MYPNDFALRLKYGAPHGLFALSPMIFVLSIVYASMSTHPMFSVAKASCCAYLKKQPDQRPLELQQCH
jgi:hypothetical protein